MARPRRAVRSVRERWARLRRFETLIARFFVVVRRSMCDAHFNDFEGFQNGLHEVCTMISVADPIVEEQISVYFHHSAKITYQVWKEYREWLMSDMGEPIRSICLPWCTYGRRAQLVCVACRGEDAILVDTESENEED
ncbi:hypothetical protein FRX31_004629 [Thalictrum thalictroides]|uniref:Uncharacterized protein n=1 Tax=Thalictrum thalictroides TaxID=46969 RepID=A0A7J6X7U2_THATH|nr:hypothetical protein FRX31_004629 [Thalictrum thalictroides]